jgi:hypothetical protein
MLQPHVFKSFVFENGAAQLRISGRSMFPFFKEGQNVLVTPLDRSLRAGRIYAYIKNNTMVGHRLVRVKNDRAVFLGDGNNRSETVDINSIIGECIVEYSKMKQLFVAIVNFIFINLPVKGMATGRRCLLWYLFRKDMV